MVAGPIKFSEKDRSFRCQDEDSAKTEAFAPLHPSGGGDN